MNEVSWRRYISLFTTAPIEIDASKLVASLAAAFRANNLPEPYSTETNAPNNEKGAPVVKVETSDGRNGVWIGNQLIFMPVGNEEDAERLFRVVCDSELASFGINSYALNSSRESIVSKEQSSQSTNPEVTALLNDPTAREFSKNVTKQLSSTLTAKDVITVSRDDSNGLTVEMSITIDSADMPSGRTVGELLSKMNLETLKAHEDEVKQQADSILIGR